MSALFQVGDSGVPDLDNRVVDNTGNLKYNSWFERYFTEGFRLLFILILMLTNEN
jgi:hypothetical protein